jgi:hypothetical protein
MTIGGARPKLKISLARSSDRIRHVQASQEAGHRSAPADNASSHPPTHRIARTRAAWGIDPTAIWLLLHHPTDCPRPPAGMARTPVRISLAACCTMPCPGINTLRQSMTETFASRRDRAGRGPHKLVRKVTEPLVRSGQSDHAIRPLSRATRAVLGHGSRGPARGLGLPCSGLRLPRLCPIR